MLRSRRPAKTKQRRGRFIPVRLNVCLTPLVNMYAYPHRSQICGVATLQPLAISRICDDW